MKTTYTPKLITAALTGVLAITTAHAADKTPGFNQKIPEKSGRPTKSLTRSTTSGAVQAYLWAYPGTQEPWTEVKGDEVTLLNVRNCDYRTETDYAPASPNLSPGSLACSATRTATRAMESN